MTVEILNADVREALARFPITSPPYWSLRDYGLEPTTWGGDAECEHAWGEESYQRRSNDTAPGRKQATNVGALGRDQPVRHAFCRRCGAWRGCLGLEPTPELYVEHLVGVLREVRRVLRDDGVMFLNMGDSYASNPAKGGSGTPNGRNNRGEGYARPLRKASAQGADVGGWTSRSSELRTTTAPSGLKPKDLLLMPARVALALQVDGWWLRSDIIWSKPNPMPESVTDRPTTAHEHVYLLAKSERYFYDADAIREPSI